MSKLQLSADEIVVIDMFARRCWENADVHGWHDKPFVYAEHVANLHGEASEAWEAYRSAGFDRWIEEPAGKPCGVMSELADTVIRAMHTAESLRRAGLVQQTLGEAINEKHTYNLGRPYRHGGKLA